MSKNRNEDRGLKELASSVAQLPATSSVWAWVELVS